MREVMVGRARVAVLRTAAKSAVLREKSRAGEDALQDFPFRTQYRPHPGACLCRKALPSYVSRGLPSRGRVAEV